MKNTKTHKKPEIKEVKEKTDLEIKEEKISELTNALQRLQAEFENYKKRNEKECSEFKTYAEENILKEMLGVIDNFELALQNKKEGPEFLKGMELIYAQLYELLENHGLKVINAKGEKFNPYKHEALLTEQSKGEENIVLEELQKGYTINEKVLRHTKVKVSKK
jgi:molecular chaperone GrpE